MNDCSNADIRDQLPDLLHDRLTVSARAVVLAHVEGCTDCRDELELLRGVLGALVAQTPRVDIAYIVGALPKAPARTTAPSVAAKRRWADWRVAAAISVLVAGGSSVAILNRAPGVPNGELAARAVEVADTQTATPSVVRSTTTPSAASAKSAPVLRETLASNVDQDATTDAGPDGRFGGLTETQLNALLSEIERLEAVPITEPEPVTIKVNVGTPTPLSQLPR